MISLVALLIIGGTILLAATVILGIAFSVLLAWEVVQDARQRHRAKRVALPARAPGAYRSAA